MNRRVFNKTLRSAVAVILNNPLFACTKQPDVMDWVDKTLNPDYFKVNHMSGNTDYVINVLKIINKETNKMDIS